MTSVEAGRVAGRPGTSREARGRADRLHLAVLAGVFTRLAAMLSAGAIAFTSLSDQILGLRAEVQEEIGGLRTEIREELGKLSGRMGQLSDRMTRVETLIETHLVPASNARDPGGP